MNFKLPTSNILVLGSNSVHCLLPSTLITRADALLSAHRLEEAVELADQQLKRLQGRVTLDTEEVRAQVQDNSFFVISCSIVFLGR